MDQHLHYNKRCVRLQKVYHKVDQDDNKRRGPKLNADNNDRRVGLGAVTFQLLVLGMYLSKKNRIRKVMPTSSIHRGGEVGRQGAGQRKDSR